MVNESDISKMLHFCIKDFLNEYCYPQNSGGRPQSFWHVGDTAGRVVQREAGTEKRVKDLTNLITCVI